MLPVVPVSRLLPITLALLLAAFPAAASAAEAEADSQPAGQAASSAAVPDLRHADTKLKVQRGNFVAVPIPTSDPTLGTGLILGAAYFYPQSDAQKKVQPASVTAVAGMYTSNKSYAYGLIQQNYWAANKWRFTGAAGHADLNLELLTPAAGGTSRASWLIDGDFLLADLARAIRGHWYFGFTARYVDIDQSIAPALAPGRFDHHSEIRSVGVGPNLKFDSRDMPLNPYSGRQLDISTLFNDESMGSDKTYQTLSASFSSYHSLTPKLVLAWEAVGCKKAGSVPLWDACRLSLRGFPATEYMAKDSVQAQVEARWRFSRRWGVVAFGGAGKVSRTLAVYRDNDLVPSVGFGLRWMVLPAKRINLRLDYGTSDGGEAIYFSVGEAF